MTVGSGLSPDAFRGDAPTIFLEAHLSDEKPELHIDKETARKLLEIVRELTELNDYELPYRVPPLRERADEVLKDCGSGAS